MALLIRLIILTCSLHEALSGTSINARQLRIELDQFMDENLATTEIEKIFDDADIRFVQKTPEEILQQLLEKLEERITHRHNVVRKLQQTIHEQYDNFESTPKVEECCKTNPATLLYSARFRRKVNTRSACYRIAGSTNRTNVEKYPNKDVLDVMRDNDKNSDLRWQYFGTEEGAHFTYPSRIVDKCDSYDPRYRPWYVQTATDKPKDVVVVMDTRGNITFNILAAQTVLETLNVNDRMGFVSFAEDAVTPSGTPESLFCYNKDLSLITSISKTYLEDYINDIKQQDAVGMVWNAIEKAFQFHNSTKPVPSDNTERRKFILLMGSGTISDPVHNALYTKCQQLNYNFQNEIIVHTYALGTSMPPGDIEVLKNLAEKGCQSNPAGKFTHVTNELMMREQIGSYYASLEINTVSTVPVVVPPYTDSSGLGLVTSICLPVHNSAGNFVGVTCVDMTIHDILAEVIHFKYGDRSYAFLINNRGHTITHPLLARPQDLTGDWPLVHISDIEQHPDVQQVLSDMMRGMSGERKVQTTYITGRGDARYEGINQETIIATYRYGKIANTSYSVCVVIVDNDKMPEISSVNLSPKFVYHNLSLHDDGSRPARCLVEEGVVGSKASSGVKFTDVAFNNPERYHFNEETMEDIHDWRFFFEENQILSDKYSFKEYVREMVLLTSKVERYWQDRNNIGQNILWKYIATYNGVIRIYPTIALPKNFDATVRPWYVKAVANRDKLTVSAPYWDVNQLYVVTISKAIIRSNFLIGVAAMDLRLEALYPIMIKSSPACADKTDRCFIMDNNGYIVYHASFLESLDQENIIYTHVTVKEKEIAYFLVLKGLLIPTNCINFTVPQVQHCWKVSEDIVTEVNNMFEIQDISGTNLYIIYKHEMDDTDHCSCTKNKYQFHMTPIEYTCQFPKDSHCECPCLEKYNFNSCSNQYTNLSYVPCTPPYPPLEKEFSPTIRDLKALAPCFPPYCEMHLSSRTCTDKRCSWCMDKCVSIEECNKAKILHIAIGCSAAAAFLIILLIAGIVLYKRCTKKQNQPSTSNPPDLQVNVRRPSAPSESERSSGRYATVRVPESPWVTGNSPPPVAERMQPDVLG